MGGSPSPWGAAHGVSSGCVTGPRSKLPSALGASRAPAAPQPCPSRAPLAHKPWQRARTTPPSAMGPYPSDVSDTVSPDPKRQSQVRCQRQHVLSRGGVLPHPRKGLLSLAWHEIARRQVPPTQRSTQAKVPEPQSLREGDNPTGLRGKPSWGCDPVLPPLL